MPQLVGCPFCTQMMSVPDVLIGKQVSCPTCKKVFLVPAHEPVREPVAAGVSGPAAPSTPPRPAPSRAVPPPPPAPKTPAAPNVCPSCKSPLLPGAIACMDCGYLIQSEAGATESETPPVLCSNPACGVANPPGERTCQRCGTPLPTAAGTVLHGRYRIDKLLAMGGFGAVYLATDLKQGQRPVAIKDMICADPQEFAIRLNFFRREADILRSLVDLPAVPRVYDFVEQGQSALLVMEFITGQDLLKVMETNQNQPFPVEQVIEWGKAICDVLDHMHRQTPPLIHRDLKPDNLMLLEDGRSIKMIDFGTARDLGRTQKDRVAAKTRVYTEGYAPPEQIIGKPEPRSDLFAMCGTLYHLATGKAPEGHYTSRELEEQLADSNSPLPAAHRWFFELIKINLAEDANERYFSAREIKADLEKRRVTREIACPKCQQTNKVREPYCTRCAEPLTEPAAACHQCGKANRMGSRCCIYCGNRLR